MITKTQYQAIRGEPDFIYRYFVKVSGMEVPPDYFYASLTAWLAAQQVPARAGQIKIIKFLDRKFGQ